MNRLEMCICVCVGKHVLLKIKPRILRLLGIPQTHSSIFNYYS